MVTLPFAPCVTAVIVSGPPCLSTSLARTGIAVGPLPCSIAGKSVGATSFFAIGSGDTRMAIVATFEVARLGSVAWKVNESLPW